MTLRLPETIMDDESGKLLVFDSFHREGRNTRIKYRLQGDDEVFTLLPWMIEKEFVTERTFPKTPLIRQGKWECAAASLAMLLGHSLFNVKRVMGSHGWCNDDRGCGDRILKLTARDFGRDLIDAYSGTIEVFKDDTPDCLVSMRSINVEGMGHGLVFLNGELLDPNFGHPNRRYWGPIWTPYTMGSRFVQILAKEPLSDQDHKDLKFIREKGKPEEIREAILSVAA